MFNNYTEAVAAAANGNQEAYTYLYNTTYQSSYYTALRIMNNEEDAYDVIQKAYIKAFGSLNTLGNAEFFPKWLKVIITRTAIDEKRKRKDLLFADMATDEETGLDFEENIEDVRIDAQPEMSFDQQETQRLIQEIIGELSEEQRFCINLFYMEQKSVKEIAALLDVTENTIKSRLFLGRKKIEEKVLDLEKKGTKLYGLAPLPFLVFLLTSMEKIAVAPRMPQVTASVASAASAPQSTGAIGKAQATAANRAATKGAGVAAKAISGKAIAGIAAAAVVVVAIASVSVATIIKHQENNSIPVVSIDDQTKKQEDLATEEEKETGNPEELLSEYLETLKAEKGCWIGLDLDVEIKNEETAGGTVYLTMAGLKDEREGILASYIADADGDGEPELIVVESQTEEPDTIDGATVYKRINYTVYVYEVEEDEVICAGQEKIDSPYYGDDGAWTECDLHLSLSNIRIVYIEEQGQASIIVCEDCMNPYTVETWIVYEVKITEDGLTEEKPIREIDDYFEENPQIDNIVQRISSGIILTSIGTEDGFLKVVEGEFPPYTPN